MNSLLAKNVGNADRFLRVVLGLALLSFTIVGPHTAWGYLGVIPLFTGIIGMCPLYAILGFNTCGVAKR